MEMDNKRAPDRFNTKVNNIMAPLPSFTASTTWRLYTNKGTGKKKPYRSKRDPNGGTLLFIEIKMQ
jgi:hypothetical protein